MHITTIAIPFLPFLTLAAPTLENSRRAAYTPGWCTFHLDLWIPTNGGWDQGDPFTAKIDNMYDGAHNRIGGDDVDSHAQPVSSATAQFDSALPLALLVASTGIDSSDGVLNFSYGDESWSSSKEEHCGPGLGGPSGSNNIGSAWEQLDCGFTCN